MAFGTTSTLAGFAIATLALGGVSATTATAGPPSEPDGSSMIGAMQRDLGLSKAEAKQRIAAEAAAMKNDRSAKAQLGGAYAGSWFDPTTGSLVVATSGPSAKSAQIAGAKVKQVRYSAKALRGHLATLSAPDAPSAISDAYIDVVDNRVVVSAVGAAEDVKRYVASADVPADAVRVVASPERPQPLAQGGDRYTIDNRSACSVGFAVDGGFVTAGHCGKEGSTTQQPDGSFAGSSFPGDDYGYVRTSASVSGTVNNYAGGSVAVRGSNQAPVGSSICRSGGTTGWNCGTIEAYDATVNYAEGTVDGLIRTNVCAEPGDSGGSAITGDQAQGVTSGGSGNCSTGGTTFFQPVNEILNAYGLTLTTS